MEAFLVSTGVVALGEIGDKTQLLALMLAARFQKPLPIIAGILVATLANHALAGFLGNLFRAFVPIEVLTWLVALSFFAVAIWALRPDKLDTTEPPPATRWGIFGVTVAAFFVAEMGDKTQVATVVLAARFPSLLAVVLGTTLGMLLANVPVVLIGKAAARKIPFKAVRIAAALLFAALGAYALIAPAMAAPAPSTEERANYFGVAKAIVADGRFAGTSVWVEGQRRWVTLKGCVRTRAEAAALERLVRGIDDVEAVVNELVVKTR